MTTKNEFKELEHQIRERMEKLDELRKASPCIQVSNYTFATLEGETTLLDLFAERDRLLAIHNMGQGCRYCTLWADGFNGILGHLESVFSVVLLSRDPPETQRRFANLRGWRFRLASHGGGDYIREQSVMSCEDNMPGAVIYEKVDGKIYRKNGSVFGPGDIYCAMWSLLGLAGLGENDWTPQYNYWRRPKTLDDGGANILE